MRYRALSPSGDYTFGQGAANFLIDSSAAAAQAIRTRLLLLTGEWFLDTTQGTPWSSEILGAGTMGTKDQAIRTRILTTQGMVNGQIQNLVKSISNYASNIANRKLTVTCAVSTIFGPVQIAVTLP